MHSEYASLWPTHLLVATLEELTVFNEELFQLSLEFTKSAMNQVHPFSFRQNSTSLMMTKKSPGFALLTAAILKHVADYLRRFYPQVDPEQNNFLLESFVNFQSSNKRWSLPHSHHGNQLVATYYPKFDLGPKDLAGSDSSGSFCLHDPRETHPAWMNRTEHNVYSRRPHAGTLFLFPGYLPHSTFPFLDEASVSLAIVANIRFNPRSDTNNDRLFSPEEIFEFQRTPSSTEKA